MPLPADVWVDNRDVGTPLNVRLQQEPISSTMSLARQSSRVGRRNVAASTGPGIERQIAYAALPDSTAYLR